MQTVFVSVHIHISTSFSSNTGATDAGRRGVTLQSSHSSRYCIETRAMCILMFRPPCYFCCCTYIKYYPSVYEHLAFRYVPISMGGWLVLRISTQQLEKELSASEGRNTWNAVNERVAVRSWAQGFNTYIYFIYICCAWSVLFFVFAPRNARGNLLIDL